MWVEVSHKYDYECVQVKLFQSIIVPRLSLFSFKTFMVFPLSDLSQTIFAMSFVEYFILFINYNTITNYILIIYELSNLNHTLGVVSQTRVSDLWYYTEHMVEVTQLVYN